MAIHQIAVIQLYPKPLQIEDNHNRACTYIREAASKGAVLAVLPEYHLTGWEPEDPAFVQCGLDYKKYLEAYSDLAASLQINVVPGTIVEAHPSSTCLASCYHCTTSKTSSVRLFNVAYFISSTGKILGSYQKINLWHSERPYLSSISPTISTPHRVILTPIGPVGMLICWDTASPEGFRSLVAQGAKIIIIPAMWTGLGSAPNGLKRNPEFEKQTLQSILIARAFENTAAIVFVNAGGIQEGNLGLSQVVMPFIGSVATPLGYNESMGIVDVDMEILEEAEDVYCIRKDMGEETWPYQKLGKVEIHEIAN